MVLFAFAWPASSRLNLDRSLQKMFSPDDPTRIGFEFLQEKFGVAELVVFAYRDDCLWQADGEGLKRLQQIRERIEKLPGIATAMDLSKMDGMLAKLSNPLSIFNTSKTQGVHPLLEERNLLAQKFKMLFEGQTHSSSSNLVAIACLIARNQTSRETSNTISRMREVGDALPADFGVSAAMLVGQPVMVEEGFEAIEADGLRLGIFSSISLSLLILIGFRSLRWALLTVAIVQWSLVVTRALLVWMAWDLTMVSSMLSSIVTVIGVATTMHWMVGFQDAMRSGQNPEQALASSMRNLWRPIFWACITDAIGFASLSFAKVGPVQDYGCMMALASLVVLVGIFCLLPTIAILPLGHSRWITCLGLSERLATVPGDSLLKGLLARTLEFAIRRRSMVTVAAVVLGLVSVLGTLRLQVETDFIKNFRNDAPLVVAYQSIENELGGAGVWDIVLPAPLVLDQKYLDSVLELERKITSLQVPDKQHAPKKERDDKVHEDQVAVGENGLRLSLVMSFADADAAARESVLLGNLSIEDRLFGMRNAMGSFVDTLITKPQDGERYLRIILRSREQSNAEQKEQLIQKVRELVAQTLRSEDWQFARDGRDSDRSAKSVSGYYVLLSELVRSVVADQWRCFAVASIGIWLAMAYALRSPLLATLAVLPNALPSLCILGFMGWMEIRVNLGAAMIAAVSMGLSVDSSLHYLMRFQTARLAGASVRDALVAAQSEIGVALGLSTGALVVGFGSLATSDFLPTVAFGTTAAISMLGGLLGNLIQLPGLVHLFVSCPTSKFATHKREARERTDSTVGQDKR